MDSYGDVRAVAALISQAGIINKLQFKKFLEKRGLDAKRIESVKKILIAERMAFVDSTGEYFSVSQATNYTKFTETIKKTVWLFIDSLPAMNYANFKCKVPAAAWFCNDSGSADISKINEYTVFYIPRGTEDISNRIINTNYGSELSTINTLIIVDEPEQIDNIHLDDIFNIITFAVVHNDGSIDYYDAEEE